MKKYFKYIVCSILFCCPFIVSAKVICNNGDYSATIDLEKNELGLNETSKITVNSDFNYEIEYRIDNAEIININENIIIPKNFGNAKINAKINFIEDNNIVGECTSILDINVLSNNSTLKLLNLEEVDISAVFKSDKLEYEVSLPYNYEKINIIAEANDPNATITGDGRRYLNEGTNEYEIIVKATDGSTTTYKMRILREDANADNTLKSLNVEGYVLSPKFQKDIFEYTLNVDESIENIVINAEATYELATVMGTGEFKLATGNNAFVITVVAENNSEQKYTIIINKNKGNSKLSKLKVNGHKLDKDFNSENYIYNITIKNNIEKLDIIAESFDNDQIEIIGNENLVVGENNIIIRVSNEDKGATTYKIIVNKLSVEEQQEIEKNDTLLKVLLVIFIISVIIMITLVIIFLKRNYKGNSNKIKKINIIKK